MSHCCPHCKARAGFSLERAQGVVDTQGFQPHEGDAILVCGNCDSILGGLSGIDPEELLSRLSDLESMVRRIEQQTARRGR